LSGSLDEKLNVYSLKELKLIKTINTKR